MPDEAFLTTGDVHSCLNVNLRTICRFIKAGKIPAVRVGRQWRFRKDDVEAWLMRQRTAAGLHPGPPPEAPSRRPRVLVVDDEKRMRVLLFKTLSRADYDVDVAPDGQAALTCLRRLPYDLLITDLKMPGMDGLAVIRQARRLKARLPVIVITGHSTEANAIAAANLGVSGYLTKPFDVPRILTAAADSRGQ